MAAITVSRGAPVTMLALEARGKTLVVLHDLQPSKEALDAAMTSGEKSGTSETRNSTNCSLPRGVSSR